MELSRHGSSSLAQALQEAERGAAKSGIDADVEEVLRFAAREIESPSLQPLWQDATELSKDSVFFKTIYSRGQRRMMEILKTEASVGGQVVGHALVRAVEGNDLYVVKVLRKALAELRMSVLMPRFTTFSLLKAVEIGSFETAQELLRPLNFASMALMGYELAKAKEDGYPFVKVNLTRDWQKSIVAFKDLLPPAEIKLQAENLELHGLGTYQEAIHVATRLCYHIYFIWRLLIIAGCSAHVSIFHGLLMRRDEHNALANEAANTSVGFENPRVQGLMRLRSEIDLLFLRLTLKVLAKQSRDRMLYQLWRATEGGRANHNSHVKTKANADATESLWDLIARSHFGLWEIQMNVPTLVMDIEGSYQDDSEKLRHSQRHYSYVKPLLPQVAKLNVQFRMSVDIQPTFIELMVGINHVRLSVENSVWEEKHTGHFPSRIYLSIVPVDAGLTSVTMTGSSQNTSVKVGVSEQVRVGVRANIKAAPAAGLSLTAGKATMAKIEGKPWQMEQLPEEGDRGGSFTWTLSNLRGSGFDRLNPMLGEVKRSIWQFGKRVPVNPLSVLPFASNGGVNFTSGEFSDTLAWRYPKDLENTIVVFNVVGRIHTTYITQDTFWETRVMPFECKVEQKLEPCGEPLGGDKKKKKKK
ncbi:unnamed protein product [Sphagnum troendelagicum]|uniref:Uncharacterized protein n=1 Tax=Sphagnum troendelagicum TaxID=128251 RepID=A0ABP0UN41_9BRYO